MNESSAICRISNSLGRSEWVGLNLRYGLRTKVKCHRRECTKNKKQSECTTSEVMFRSIVNKFGCCKTFAQIHPR